MIYFRLPFEDKINTVIPKNHDTVISFFSFDGVETFQFKGEIKSLNYAEFSKEKICYNLNDRCNLQQLESKDSYLKKIEKAISFVKENKIPKLVIARRIPLNFQDIDLKQSFLNLCYKYPNAFVYLFEQNQECWMGAFSESLGIFDKNSSEFSTMSLAGTLPTNESWTEKEIEEQKPVTEYITEILSRHSTKIDISKTYDHISGNIKHLRTDFRAVINVHQLEKIILELHPTPAVCGIPKELCKQASHNFEEFSRELYSGFSKIEIHNKVFYFVNLRCAKIYQNHADLFAGGGITALSNPDKEWQETELKSQAIRNNLAIF